MECTINGIPAWEHPKQMGCGAAADVISISTGSSSVSRGLVDDGTPPSSPQQRPSFLNLLPTRNSNANSRRHVSASSPNSNAVKGKVSVPTSPIRLPPTHQPQQQRQPTHTAAQQQHRTPNTSMDHRRMLNMDGYLTPNKMMITFDIDSQSCCPSVGDITWDHTETMAFHNNAVTSTKSSTMVSSHRRQQQQQHPWENFKEMKVEPTSTNSRESSNNNNRSPIPPKSKNRVFPTTAVPASDAVAQQHQQQQVRSSKAQPKSKPQQQAREFSVHDVVASTCPSTPDSSLLPMRPNSSKSKQKSLSSVPQNNRSGSTGRPTPFTYISSTYDAPLLPLMPSIPLAPTVHTKENCRTEINVNFSDCFVSQKEGDDVPSIIDVESSSQHAISCGKKSTGNSSIDDNIKSTTLPHKEIDVIHPITITVPSREKRNDHLRTALPIPTTSSTRGEDPLSGTTITTTTIKNTPKSSRSNSYGSDIVAELTYQDTRDSNGRNCNHSSFSTLPMSNLTFTKASGNGVGPRNSLSKHSSSSMERHYQTTTSNSEMKNTSRLTFDNVRQKQSSSRVDDGSFHNLNVSKSSLTTSKSCKSTSSQRSSSYNTVQQLEESIQNLEATLQMTATNDNDDTSKRVAMENDDRLVNLALESSFNDIYLRPSTTCEKRSVTQHPRHCQNRQFSQESLSATTCVSMFSSSMMSSCNMSMNSNNSIMRLQHRQPVPPNMLIQINTTISAATTQNINDNVVVTGSKSDDVYAEIESALAISSATMDDL